MPPKQKLLSDQELFELLRQRRAKSAAASSPRAASPRAAARAASARAPPPIPPPRLDPELLKTLKQWNLMSEARKNQVYDTTPYVSPKTRLSPPKIKKVHGIDFLTRDNKLYESTGGRKRRPLAK